MKKIVVFLLLACSMMMCSVSFAATHATVTADAVATRSGPGTKYTEPGGFLYRGASVKVHTKVWDDVNEIFWVQIEFTSGNQRYRVYTGDWRLDVNLNMVPEETVLSYSWLTENTSGYAGPGYDYHYDSYRLRKGNDCCIMEVENGFALIDMADASRGWMRCWVPLSTVAGGYELYGQNTYPDDLYGDQGATLLPGGEYDENYPIGRACMVWVESGHARSGAGVEYDHVAYINRGDVLTVLDSRMGTTGKDWYKVRVDGRLGWVSSALVMLDGNTEGTAYGVPIQPVDALAEYPQTASYLIGSWIRVTADGANVRQKPDTATPVVAYVSHYECYEILECRVGSTGKVWYKIRLNNQTGWISSGLTTLLN